MSDDVASYRLADLRGPATGEDPVLRPIPFPGGARLAVNFQVAVEAWAGTNVSGSAYGGRNPNDASATAPDWATISSQDYGGRTGFWRLFSLVEEQQIPATFTMSGLVGVRWPEIVRTVTDAGHEIVGHGYSQDQSMHKLDEAEDLDVVTRATEALEAAGQRPIGWASHGSRRGNFTVLSLMKNGYLYTNDFRDADVPYIVAELGEQKLLSMPRSDQVNDMFTVHLNGNSPGLLVDYFKRSFDQAYKEGGKVPTVVNCVVHSTISGRQWGVAAFEECIEYAKLFPEAWICRRREVAQHAMSSLTASTALAG